MNLFDIKEYDYENRKRNLTTKASGVVSSTKYFPVFEEDGKEKIFKPLSKTKPYSTPLFSYSEVYWSYLINKYIDKETPIYSLGYCHNISSDQPKYYEKGCIVNNVLGDGEVLVNLLEFYRMYPDNLVNIDDYTNYCEMQYDYTPILKSDFFRNNEVLSRKLSEQILCSILRRDDNYHYENVSLVFKDGIPIRIAPIIDLEFSQMFMFSDKTNTHENKFSHYDEGMMPIFSYDNTKNYEENLAVFLSKIDEGSIYDNFDISKNYLVMKNIKTIVSLHPDLVQDFIKKLELMKNEVENLNIDFDTNFLGSFSSDDWYPTRMLFKENKTETDEEYIMAKLKAEANRITLNQESFNQQLKSEVIWSIDKLISVIEFFVDINNKKYPDLTLYESKTLYQKVSRYREEIMKIFLEDFKKIKKEKEKIKK